MNEASERAAVGEVEDHYPADTKEPLAAVVNDLQLQVMQLKAENQRLVITPSLTC